MAKYIGLINIENEKDIERFKSTDLYEKEMDEMLKSSPGTWLHFDIDYLELFWMSETRRQILDSGLVLAIKKAKES